VLQLYQILQRLRVSQVTDVMPYGHLEGLKDLDVCIEFEVNVRLRTVVIRGIHSDIKLQKCRYSFRRTP
jgi:hypothetical protein